MPSPDRLPVASLPQRRPVEVDLRPDEAARAALAGELGLTALRKLRLTGELAPSGDRDWLFLGTLGATVEQPCIVTLDPVTTRIDVPVRRLYLADPPPEPDVAGSETEMPEDDEAEPLGAVIDLGRVLSEALALSIPLYPRAEGVEFDPAAHGLEDAAGEDRERPFAALAGLRRKLEDGE